MVKWESYLVKCLFVYGNLMRAMKRSHIVRASAIFAGTIATIVAVAFVLSEKV